VIRYFTREKRKLIQLTEPDPGCWVHLSPPFNPDELEEFARRFGFDLVFLTDSLDLDERARYERDEVTIEHVITVSAFESPVLEQFLNNNIRDFNPADEKRFVLQLLEQNVYHFLSCLKTLNLRRNRMEKELLNSSRNNELKQLLSIEKSLVYFVNSLNANELLKMKMKRTDFLHINGDEDLTDLFEDIIIDNSQALSMSNVYTNILNGTMDAYSSIISNNLNIVIHRLTVITVVLMVPTLISSFFGMNIPNGIPEHPTAFYATILFTGVFTGILYWLMQKRKML